MSVTAPSDRKLIKRGLSLLVALALQALSIYFFAFNIAADRKAVPTVPVTEVRIVDLPDPFLTARDVPALKQVRLSLPTLQIIIPAVSIVFPSDLPMTHSPPTLQAPSVRPKAGGSTGTGTGGRRVLKEVSPDFNSLPAGIKGTTTVRALVAEDGHVKAVKILKSSGYYQLDQTVVHAVRQWLFEPQTAESSNPMQFSCCINLRDVFNGITSFMIFDQILADQLRAWVLPTSDSGSHIPRTDSAVGSLIDLIQNSLRGQETGVTGIDPSHLLATWGKVQSVQFLTDESRGLQFDTASGELDASAQIRWRLYGVRQAKGTFIWLAGVDDRGAIKALEGMACVTICLRLPAARAQNVAGHVPADTRNP